MSDCTERHPAAPNDGLAAQIRKRLPREGSA
jgi:hypothetical protein